MKVLLSVPPCLLGCADVISMAAGNAFTASQFFCSCDPPSGHLGSGGGTTYLLEECWRNDSGEQKQSRGKDRFISWLSDTQRVLIHAGGQSRRLPSYGPAGKVLTPIPVLHWSRGQHTDQTLLSMQMPLYESIMAAAPTHLNTLIACGDTYITYNGSLQQLSDYSSDIDVVCFGIWKDINTLKNHGVFFMPRSQEDHLEFMLQKPSSQEIHSRAIDRSHLMDAGLWLLSPRAAALLRDRSTRADGTLQEYDLYGEFGCALGDKAIIRDAELNALKVRIVNLTDGSFYHYGTSRELLSSTCAIQTMYNPLGASGEFKSMVHPTVFAQNALIRQPYSSAHEQLWLENSCIGARWRLHTRHVVTGVPENDWTLDLPAGTCISVVPVAPHKAVACQPPSFVHTPYEYPPVWHVARPYGFEDPFKGSVFSAETVFQGQSLQAWMLARGIEADELLPISGDADIQNARLFPCCDSVEMLEDMLRWMIAPPEALVVSDEDDAHGNAHSRDKSVLLTMWQFAPRLSATDLNIVTDMRAVVAQRIQYQRQTLPQMSSPRALNPFYHTDLGMAARQFVALRLPLPSSTAQLSAVADTSIADSVSMKSVHFHMFCAQILYTALREVRNSKDAAACRELLETYGFAYQSDMAEAAERYDAKAFSILRAAMIQSISSERHSPKLSVFTDQIVWGRSPARIDLSGGWTDTPPYSVLCGGSVINIAIELNGQPPIQVYVKLSATPEIVLRSIDMGTEDRLSTFEDIRRYSEVGSAFSIPKAALALAGFVPEFCSETYSSLQEQLEQCFDGQGIEITLLVAIPAGSGLGTSSIIAGTVLQSLSEFCGLGWDTHAVCRRVLVLEQMLTTGGGWQDQYGGLFHGLKLVQSIEGFRQDPSVRWMPEHLFTDMHHKPCHLLYYTGITRTAKTILTDIVRGMFLNDASRLRVLAEMRDQTQKLYDAITRGSFQEYGRLIGRAWEQNKRLDSGTCTPEVQRIVDLVSPFALGFKLAGAGGGGYLYIVAKDPHSAQQIRDVLRQNPPNTKARFVDMTLASSGVQVSKS